MPNPPLGTLVNIAAVIIGSGAGLLLHRAFPERFSRILLTAGGLATLVLGTQMAIKSGNPLILIGSLYLGALIGEALGIEAWLERIGNHLQRQMERPGVGGSQGNQPGFPLETPEEQPRDEPPSHAPHQFTHGLVTAFLIFCVGPMTIVGSLNEGISGDHSLLYVKSMLDLVTSFALATSFGSGVLFSVVPLALFQLGITAVGAVAGKAFTEAITAELTAVGGTLIIGLGFNLLGIARLRIANLLPALLIVILAMLLIANL